LYKTQAKKTPPGKPPNNAVACVLADNDISVTYQTQDAPMSALGSPMNTLGAPMGALLGEQMGASAPLDADAMGAPMGAGAPLGVGVPMHKPMSVTDI
jgi:hypothetical protein